MTDIREQATRLPEDKQLAEELAERAKSDGVELVGPDGLLAGLTKNVLEAGLEAEMSEHLGYDKHDAAGRNKGNSRNGTRAKKLLTDVGRSISRSLETVTPVSNPCWSRNTNAG